MPLTVSGPTSTFPSTTNSSPRMCPAYEKQLAPVNAATWPSASIAASWRYAMCSSEPIIVFIAKFGTQTVCDHDGPDLVATTDSTDSQAEAKFRDMAIQIQSSCCKRPCGLGYTNLTRGLVASNDCKSHVIGSGLVVTLSGLALIQPVPQRIADQIDAHDQEEHDGSGDERHMRRSEKE